MTIQPRLPFLANKLWAIKTWVDVADWRSWIAHSVIGVGVTLFLLLLYWLFWLVGLSPLTAVTLVIWGLREGEQLAFEVMYGEKIKWVDHIGDVLVPAILTQIIFG